MRWRKRDLWKAAAVATSILFLALVTVSVADARGSVSGLATAGTVTVQATPTIDATVIALQKQQLILQNKQLQQSEDRGLAAWLWSNAAAVLSSFLSTLVVVIGALIGFRQWSVSRRDTQKKDAEDRQVAHDKDRRAQAEERFKAAITALGSENEATQVGGAILLRSFLNPADEEIYGRYYSQIFDLAVAYLRLSNGFGQPEDLDELPPTGILNASVSLTPLRHALIVVFKEVFPLARRRLGKPKSASDILFLDASRVRLDRAFLASSNLSYTWMVEASLGKTNLVKANLSEGILTAAYLVGTYFTGADLTGTNLIMANLTGAKLDGANLTEANLFGANLSGANLSEANIEDALYLKNADLRGAKGLTKEQLLACKAKGAIVDEDTTASPPQAVVPPSLPPQQSP